MGFKKNEGLPLVSGHFTERIGLQRAYFDDPAVQYVKHQRSKENLDEKDLNDKIKLEVQYQLWLEKKRDGKSYPSQGTDSKTNQSQS